MAESWERKTSVTLCWKIEFWFEKKRRKSKENVKTLFLIEVKQKLFFFFQKSQLSLHFSELWKIPGVYSYSSAQGADTWNPYPFTWTTCGFWLAPSKCFSFPLDFEQESWVANGNFIETDVFLFSLNCNFLAKISVWKILARLTDRAHTALKTEGMLKTIIWGPNSVIGFRGKIWVQLRAHTLRFAREEKHFSEQVNWILCPF